MAVAVWPTADLCPAMVATGLCHAKRVLGNRVVGRYSKILGSQFRVPQSHECEDNSPIKVSSVISKCSLCSALHNKVKRLQKELQEERDATNDAMERREQLETYIAAQASSAEQERQEREVVTIRSIKVMMNYNGGNVW